MAFERLLVPFRPERVLVETADLLAVDKPSGMVVHGGDTSMPGDLVSRLRATYRERGEDDYLGVHQRLDTGTSGVMLFARRPDANRVLSAAIEARLFKKSYVACVQLSDAAGRAFERGGERGEVLLEHQLLTEDGVTRVVSRGGQLARSRVRLLERRAGLALCELWLETGRTHQARVQLAALGAPILGDDLYAPESPQARPRSPLPVFRLMLHARSVELPDGRRFEAPVPAAFARLLRGEGEALGSPEELLHALLDAACLRTPLQGRADAFRLVSDTADQIPGLTIDRYGDFAVISPASEVVEARVPEIGTALLEGGARGVYLKRRARRDLRRENHAELAPAEPIFGDPAPERFLVHEPAGSFWVELAPGLSTGLFLDQREGRERVRKWAAARSVLNLFSYTCSFSVAAALGGASRVVSVDLSRRALELGKENFKANDLRPEAFEFVREDCLVFLKHCLTRGKSFDLVILDPPSFSSEGGGKAWNARSDYGRTAELALRVLTQGGRLLAVTNHRGTSLGRLRKTLREAAQRAERPIAQLKDMPSPLDCPALPSGPHPSKSVLLTLA